MDNCPTVVLATPAWSLNGPNVFSANLARELNARQIPSHIVVTRPDWVDAKPLPPPPDVPMRTLPVRPCMSLRARWSAMVRYLEECAPCIYVPNYDFGHSCVSPRLSDRVAIVGIVHSDDPQHYEHVARLGRYWNAVVAVSSAIADQVRKIAPSVSPRLSTIPYGVTSAGALPSRSRALRQPLRVIYAGRLDHSQKRVLDLPDILKVSLELGVPVHLTIAGRGPAEGQLRSRCSALGVEGHAEFLGTLDREALAKVLAQQDVFLLASDFEGLPLGVLEAMGQGCVPIVKDIRSGIGDVVTDGLNGYLVAPDDLTGFAARLADLYHDPEMRGRMAAAAYNTVRSGCYRLDSMVESYVELFGRVLADTRCGTFRRPPGPIDPPPGLPWQEHLPEPIQRAGHYGRRLLAMARG